MPYHDRDSKGEGEGSSDVVSDKEPESESESGTRDSKEEGASADLDALEEELTNNEAVTMKTTCRQRSSLHNFPQLD